MVDDGPHRAGGLLSSSQPSEPAPNGEATSLKPGPAARAPPGFAGEPGEPFTAER